MNYCPTLWSVVMSLHDVRSEIEILGVELASRYVIYECSIVYHLLEINRNKNKLQYLSDFLPWLF